MPAASRSACAGDDREERERLTTTAIWASATLEGRALRAWTAEGMLRPPKRRVLLTREVVTVRDQDAVVLGYLAGVSSFVTLTSGKGSVGVGAALERSVWMMVDAVQVGWAERSRAAAPATSGAEALVPMACT